MPSIAVDQHWGDLLESVTRESEKISGFGEVRVRVILVGGLPQMVFAEGREAHYKLGKTLPPLTGRMKIIDDQSNAG